MEMLEFPPRQVSMYSVYPEGLPKARAAGGGMGTGGPGTAADVTSAIQGGFDRLKAVMAPPQAPPGGQAAPAPAAGTGQVRATPATMSDEMVAYNQHAVRVVSGDGVAHVVPLWNNDRFMTTYDNQTLNTTLQELRRLAGIMHYRGYPGDMQAYYNYFNEKLETLRGEEFFNASAKTLGDAFAFYRDNKPRNIQSQSVQPNAHRNDNTTGVWDDLQYFNNDETPVPATEGATVYHRPEVPRHLQGGILDQETLNQIKQDIIAYRRNNDMNAYRRLQETLLRFSVDLRFNTARPLYPDRHTRYVALGVQELLDTPPTLLVQGTNVVPFSSPSVQMGLNTTRLNLRQAGPGGILQGADYDAINADPRDPWRRQ
jgi:hypothetical protein